MRIISKFKDYYDGTQYLGIDKTLIFERFQQTKSFNQPEGYENFILALNELIELDRINLENGDYNSDQEHIDCEQISIGFCGKIYSGFKFSHIKQYSVIQITCLFDTVSILKYISSLKAKYKKLYFRGQYGYHLEEPKKKSLDDFFNQSIFNNVYNHWFQEFQTPIFKVTSDPNISHSSWNGSTHNENIHILINPKLKDYQFYRVKNAFSAYQEIAQFLDGVLTRREKLKDNSTDNEKIQQHGFDMKYGFRKRPKQ